VQKVSDIYELARLLIASGNPPRFSRASALGFDPAHEPAQSDAERARFDELGFITDPDVRRCYLTRPIDFGWLGRNVILEPPLSAAPEYNRVYGDWIEIVGGSEEGS
jgi:hypothetical protein